MLALPERRATHEVLRFRATLRTLFNQGGASRLEAIQAARNWGDLSILPLLRQALRDPDPAVVREAAAAIHRFRGRPGSGAQKAPQPVAAPRRVARTR
jgi:HEAT repeat protein